MGNSASKRETEVIRGMIGDGHFMASRVSIKQEHAKTFPFDRVRSRLATATILAYFDFKEEVIIMV